MTKEEINKYRFLGALALKYRLSLLNVCKLAVSFGIVAKSTTIYENLLNSMYSMYGHKNRNNSDITPIKYLFNVETLNETQEVRKESYDAARSFIDTYKVVPRSLSEIESEIKQATQENNEEKLGKLRNEQKAYSILYSEELNYDALKKAIRQSRSSGNKFMYSDNDILIMSEYRLKYSLSRMAITADMDISTGNYTIREQRITDPKFVSRIQALNDFYEDLLYSNLSNRIAKH